MNDKMREAREFFKRKSNELMAQGQLPQSYQLQLPLSKHVKNY